MKNKGGKYGDIIGLPHYELRFHQRMSLQARAAQFAPFAALTGYDEAIDKTSQRKAEEVRLEDAGEQEEDYPTP